MAMAYDTRETLSTRGKRWKAAISDSATGPLIIAKEIVSLSKEWEQWRSEAEGVDCTFVVLFAIGFAAGAIIGSTMR